MARDRDSKHALTHQLGGDDPLKLDSLGLPDDSTSLNASTVRHGLLPKLTGETDRYLNAAGQWVQVQVSPGEIDSVPPAVPGGLGIATGFLTDTDGVVRVYLDFDWDAVADSDCAYYQLDYRRFGDTFWTTRTITADKTSCREIGVVGNVLYEARVCAIDQLGNQSAYCTTVTQTSAKDNTPPGPPTNVTIQAGFQACILSWTKPTDDDFDVVEIWRSGTNDSTTATRIAEQRGQMFIDAKLTIGFTYRYWLRSRDTSKNTSGFHTTQYNGTPGIPLAIVTDDMGEEIVTANKIAANAVTAAKILAGEIYGTHLAAADIITQSAQIQDGLIQNAHIVSLSADKLTAATISVLLNLGVNQIELDGVNNVITIKDTNPTTRVKLGKLGTGASDYGLRIWNNAGGLMFDLNGATTTGIQTNAVTKTGWFYNSEAVYLTNQIQYVADVPLTTYGTATLIIAMVMVFCNGTWDDATQAVDLRLYRDDGIIGPYSTQIHAHRYFGLNCGTLATLVYLDTPGANEAHTFHLGAGSIYDWSPNQPYVTQRILIVTELKR